MKKYSKILVSVDLAKEDRFVCESLTEQNEEAVRKGIRLAKEMDASMTFFYSLDISAQTRQLIKDSDSLDANIRNQSEKALDHLVARAEYAGVTATRKVVFGKSWLSIIQEVQSGNHDLVIAGTKHKGRLEAMFYGSTGVNLVRKCPCPVLLSHPLTDREPCGTVIVATDFSPASDSALFHATMCAVALGADLHVVHVLEFPERLYMVRGGATEEAVERYHVGLLAAGNRKLEKVRASVEELDQSISTTTHLLEGDPDEMLAKYASTQLRPLMVIGTIARSGIPGMLLGNTAERLLTRLNCSLLAVKPEKFVSPVPASSSE